MPLVSIGLPVYNGSKFIAQALESLLNQSFRDFELIIADNASTDNTYEICRQYAEKDARIVLIRNQVNIGMLQNFRLVFRKSSGTYFMWGSDHDLWSADFIQELSQVLNANAEVVLAYAKAQDIDGAGAKINGTQQPFETYGQSKIGRIKAVCSRMSGAGYMIYGLYRSAALAKTSIYPDFAMPDRIVLMELALQGSYKYVDKILWSRRHPGFNPRGHDPMISHEHQIQRQRATLFPQGAKIPWHSRLPVLGCALGLLYFVSIKPAAKTYANFFWGPYMAYCFIKRKKAFVKKEMSLHPFIARLKSRLRRIANNDSIWSRIIKNDRQYWSQAKLQSQSGQRVLIATSMGGFQHGSLLESILTVALTLRGAHVEVLLCDSFLPACQLIECNNTTIENMAKTGPLPRCRSCENTGWQLFGPLGIKVHKYSTLVTGKQRREAKDVAYAVSLDQVDQFKFHDLAVGEHALAGALRYFAVGELKNEPQGELVLRRYLEAALLSVFALENLLRKNHYDIACFNHGIYVPQGLIGEVCRAQGIQVVNWNPSYRTQTFIFSHNDSYHHTMISEPVSAWENIPWNKALETMTMDYLKSRWQGTQDWIWFHEKPEEDINQIAKKTGIDFSKPTIGLLTNVMWDAQLHYKSNAFKNMLDWVIKTIDYFAARPELQLVIRIHPAEIRGMLPSRQPLAREIARHFPSIPANVFLIMPENDVSTYAVVERCQAVIIYNTKTGIEISSMGIPVIVAGEAWIRNKGFSLDASSVEEYFQILDRLPLTAKLDADQLQRAKKYAFHFFFRRMIPIPFIISPEKYKFALKVDALSQLMPGKYPGLDVICNGILKGTPFIYPAEQEGLQEKYVQ